ncbi:hypothetical protein [Streptomyces sp. P5_D11]
MGPLQHGGAAAGDVLLEDGGLAWDPSRLPNAHRSKKPALCCEKHEQATTTRSCPSPPPGRKTRDEPRGNPAPLAEARRRHSLDKRARVLTVLATPEKQGKPLTFAAGARAARVSTWLTYAPGVREHIEAAQVRQAHSTPPAATASPPSALSLRTELEIARQEIKDLRDERDRLQAALRHQLGYQIDAIHGPDAATRADELTTLNQDLTRQLQEASAENATCRARITALEDDLTAARTSLRRMIRDENLR